MNMPREFPALLHASPNVRGLEKSEVVEHHHPMAQEASGLVVTDHDGIVVHVDSLAEKIFHREGGLFVGQPFGFQIAEGEKAVIEIFGPDGAPYRAELSAVDGEWAGKPANIISLRRIDDWRTLKIIESLQKSNHRFLALINASPLAIVTLSHDASVMFWSRSAEKLFGWNSHEVLGQVPPILSGDGHNDFAFWCDQILDEEAPLEMEFLGQRTRDGGLIDLRVWASNLEDEPGSLGGVMMIADVTEHKRAQAQIQFLTTHDELTGLPNRTLLCDRLSQELLRISRDGGDMVAVLIIGLNNFELVLQSLGFAVGDLLLNEVAKRLGRVIRQSDTLARYGENTFALVLPSLEQEQDTVKVAGKILDKFVTPFFFEGQEIFLSASVGIAMSSFDGECAEELLRNADAAKRRAHLDAKSDFHSLLKDQCNFWVNYQAHLEGSLTSEVIEDLRSDWMEKLDSHSDMVIDLSGVECIDLAGLNLMLQIQEKALLVGKHIDFIGFNPAIEDALTVFRWLAGLVRDQRSQSSLNLVQGAA